MNSAPGERPAESAKSPRRYLFLQGPIGPFIGQVGAALQRAGHTVYRINFNGGDGFAWPLPGAVDYLGDREGWTDFLAEKLVAWRITDIILFGDCRPLHRAAIVLARQAGVAVHVLEEGYLRPGWVTLEAGGVNGYSSMPHDPAWYLSEARTAPAVTPVTWNGDGFVMRAVYDIQYNLGVIARMFRFRKYKTHKPWHPSSEYRAGFWRFWRIPAMKRQAREIVESIVASGCPYYVFPLQLDADSQLRYHSPFGGMTAAIERVIDSFARHAPADAVLAVTEHPLDQGVIDLREIAEACAKSAGVASRVHFIHCGTPQPLIDGCRGLITVNSTMGLSALSEGRRVIALGRAIYALPGMTFQGGLDAFWNGHDSPDVHLVDAFRRVIAQRTQLRGGIFSARGRAIAVEAMLARLKQFVEDSVIVPGQTLVGVVPRAERPIDAVESIADYGPVGPDEEEELAHPV